jgi:hypothetical protein
VSIIVVVAALATGILLFWKMKHHPPKAPVVTDYFIEEDHGLGLEAREVCSVHPGYTRQSQVYKLI